MNKKTLISIAASTFITTLAVIGVTYAATPASNNTSLLNQGTVEVDSLKVGSAGGGGVTFFNGTIINEGTQTPVTFGDDVRVDGRIWRGANQGPGLSDNKPFIINDDTQVAGSFTVGGTDIFAAIDVKGDKSLIDAKANISDVYTKNETDTKDALKGNVSDVSGNTTSIANNANSISTKADDSNVVKKVNPSWNTRTGYVMVGRNAFQPQDSSAYDPDYIFELGLYENSAVAAQYTASVDLPHGATLTEFKPYYVDATNLGRVSFQFLKTATNSVSPANVNSGVLQAASVSDTPGKTSLTEVISEVVDNSANEYHIVADFDDGGVARGSALAIHSVRITYTYAQPY